MSVPLKDTLNLPETDFPMRAGLTEREPRRIEHWEREDLYGKIQEKNAGNEAFILHDGPPFTNGDIHMGTTLNKVLKDVILKYKAMRGFRTPYVPGWDCHGLPIEQKVLNELRKKKKDFTTAELRSECQAFSRKYIEIMSKQFARLGVLADWDGDVYRTMDAGYEAEIVRTFAGFVDRGLVYRSKKPIYWSIPYATALAEAEIEYKDHVSPSIYVPFKVRESEQLPEDSYFVIWTTTPWTIPANVAIAVNGKLKYQEIRHKGKTYIVAEPLAEAFIETCKLEGAERSHTHTGESLEGIKYEHPFIKRMSPVVLADYVTTDSGTGCVHTAPGHGPDDFITGQKYNLDIYCPVDNRGKYEDDGVLPESLVGLSLLSKNGKCPANDAVIELLKSAGALLKEGKCEHSYPHCWRSKTPVIYRAMAQWFVSLDHDNFRSKLTEAVAATRWRPEWGENRIRSTIETRPDWCISRQRSWGVPIPAFYDEDGNAMLDSGVIRHIADIISNEGSNVWFEWTAEALLEGAPIPEAFAGKKLSKGNDTLDVWIDSGSSHQAVLKGNPKLSWPADLYIEGSDQHRGWFQSSLWTSVVLNDKAPFKTVATHGFVVDENKKKISKSDKGTKTALEYVDKYGVDILRLWIASEDFRNDIPFSENILKHIIQTYRTLRNTLRFQLGNLSDFDYESDQVAPENLPPLDRWALHQTAKLIEEVTEAYENYRFHHAYQLLNRFVTVTLSAIYHDILKDRLYTYAPNWPERRASQTVIYHQFNTIVRLLAPVIPFTADEAYGYFQNNAEYGGESIHMKDWPELNPAWIAPEVVEEVESIFKVRDRVNEKLEEARQGKVLGQSLDAHISLNMPTEDPSLAVLRKYEKMLPEFFIVSQVSLHEEKGKKELDVTVKPADGVRCPRSWRWVSNLVNLPPYGDVSPRCKEALLQKYPENTLSQQS